MRKLDIVAEEKEGISQEKKMMRRDEIHWFNLHRARVLRHSEEELLSPSLR